jgi:hypothetical protein
MPMALIRPSLACGGYRECFESLQQFVTRRTSLADHRDSNVDGNSEIHRIDRFVSRQQLVRALIRAAVGRGLGLLTLPRHLGKLCTGVEI